MTNIVTAKVRMCHYLRSYGTLSQQCVTLEYVNVFVAIYINHLHSKFDKMTSYVSLLIMIMKEKKIEML